MAELSATDEVRASAQLHHNGVRDSWIPLITLQFRPHAMVAAGAVPQLVSALRGQFQSTGWESPVLMFRGGHLATSGRVQVMGALGAGPVTITGDGQTLYEGPLRRPPLWPDLVRKAGSVGVLVGFDPNMDDPAVMEDLAALAEQGKLLAAYGELTPAPGLPDSHPLRRRPSN